MGLSFAGEERAACPAGQVPAAAGSALPSQHRAILGSLAAPRPCPCQDAEPLSSWASPGPRQAAGCWIQFALLPKSACRSHAPGLLGEECPSPSPSAHLGEKPGPRRVHVGPCEHPWCHEAEAVLSSEPPPGGSAQQAGQGRSVPAPLGAGSLLTRCLRPASGHCSKCCRLQNRARHRGGRHSPEHKAPSVLARGGWCHCPHPGARLAAPGDGVGRDPALRAWLLPHGVGQSCSRPFSPHCLYGCWPKPTGNPSATPLRPISQPLTPQGCPVPPLQTTQPGTGRNQVLFLAPPTDGSQHARPFPQQQALPPAQGAGGELGLSHSSRGTAVCTHHGGCFVSCSHRRHATDTTGTPTPTPGHAHSDTGGWGARGGCGWGAARRRGGAEAVGGVEGTRYTGHGPSALGMEPAPRCHQGM